MSDPTLPPTPPPPDPYYAPPPMHSVPMAALAYLAPVTVAGRPGILTAVGVISIVVASFGVLGSLYTGVTLLMFNAMASFAPVAMPAPNTPGMTPTTAPANVSPAASSVVVTERGLESAERAAVAAGLGELRFLSTSRVEQLDALLAEAGKDIFAGAGKPLTADRIETLVQSHATGLSADPSVPGPDTFRTESGRFELYDDRAVFYPNRGDIVRVSTLTTSTAGLNGAQVERVVAQAQVASGNTMNPSQLAGLRTLLSSPGQQHVSVVTLPTAIRGAQPMGDGSVMVTFPNGMAQVGPQGQIQMSSFTAADGTMTTTTANAGTFTVGGPFGGGGGRVRVNGAAMALAGFATLVGTLLAVYLLVSGILVLRDSQRGRKLHLIYAWLKIPVTILGALAVWWLTTSLFESMMAQSGAAGVAASPAMSMGIGIQQAVMAVFGLIYPVALLIVMQTRGVKDYYNAVRVD